MNYWPFASFATAQDANMCNTSCSLAHWIALRRTHTPSYLPIFVISSAQNDSNATQSHCIATKGRSTNSKLKTRTKTKFMRPLFFEVRTFRWCDHTHVIIHIFVCSTKVRWFCDFVANRMKANENRKAYLQFPSTGSTLSILWNSSAADRTGNFIFVYIKLTKIKFKVTQRQFWCGNWR